VLDPEAGSSLGGLDRTTNQSLNRRNPKDYFQEIKVRLGEQKFEELLQSHLLPVGADSPLLANDYPGFLEWRCKRIAQLIEEVTTGAKVAHPSPISSARE
jgi:hypothetical protein